MGAWSGAWEPSLEALAKSGHRAVAGDLPPFGYAQRPASRDYTTTAQAQRLLALIDTLGGEGVVLVGHSFGARATVEAALQLGDRLRALVLVAPALGLQQDPAPPGAVERLLLETPPVRNTLAAALGTNPWMTGVFLHQFTARHEVLTAERIDVYRRPLVVEGSTEAVGDWAKTFVLDRSRPASALADSYRRIDVPVLLIWGDRDTVTPLAQGRHLAALLPQVQFELLEGIGHIPQLEDEAAFNVLLLKFLGRLPQRS